MSRHHRRAEAAGRAEHRRDLQRGVEVMQAEGQGVWQLQLITPDLVLSSSPPPAQALRAIGRTIGRMMSASPAALCLLCDTEFGGTSVPLAFVMIRRNV